MREPQVLPVLVVGLGCVVACGHRDDERVKSRPEVPLTDAQRAELDRAIAASRAKIAELDAPWRGAVLALDPASVPGDNPGCQALGWAAQALAGNAQGWSKWPVASPLRFNGASMRSFTGAPFPLAFLAADDDVPEHSPEAAARLAELDRLARGASSTRSFEDRRDEATVDALRTTDVLVRLQQVVEPKLLDRGRFAPGSIDATAWVFDHGAGALVCAGVVHVESSPTVDPGSSNLDDDLVIELVRALPGGLSPIAR